MDNGAFMACVVALVKAGLSAALRMIKSEYASGDLDVPDLLKRPEVVALARKLRRRKPKAGQLSLRRVAKELAARGYLNERGKP
jgi:hypothetical protein